MIDGERFVTQPGGEVWSPWARTSNGKTAAPFSTGTKRLDTEPLKLHDCKEGQAVSGTDTQAVGVTHDVVRTLRCVSMTPFGRPVEPEV